MILAIAGIGMGILLTLGIPAHIFARVAGWIVRLATGQKR
jgi:hypothetical protein